MTDTEAREAMPYLRLEGDSLQRTRDALDRERALRIVADEAIESLCAETVTQRDLLTQARGYMQHDEDCEVNKYDAQGCTCGYSRLIALIDGETKP